MTDRSLWIDGAEHIVPQAVWAHSHFQSALISSLSTRAAELASEISGLKSQIEASRVARGIHWTPEIKEAVIWRVRIGDTERANTLRVFDLSAEELDGWIARYDAHGINGLKTTRLQDLGRKRA